MRCTPLPDETETIWTMSDPAFTPGREIVARIEALAAISEAPDALTRIYLTPEHRKAADQLLAWMREAGMAAHMDAIGNVVGRYEGERVGLPCLMLGSHYDTVRNAGKWDGPLGVITAISCVAELNRRGTRFPFAIEMVGFADEEGVRFSSTLLGSRAIAGTFDPRALDVVGRDGVSMRDALKTFGLDPEKIKDAARRRGDVIGYIELHIEQGPVLENLNLPVGVVTAISGASRFIIHLEGMAGHAGTVPMDQRRDALAGAAECILMIERYCRARKGLVGTVGQASVLPGATNVIPGRVSFTLDVRSGSDDARKAAVADLTKEIGVLAAARQLDCRIEQTHENRSVPCAAAISSRIAAAIKDAGFAVHELPSGAGHDGMAIADIADIGMIFVRCRGGLSHHPDEHVDLADAEIGAQVLLRTIETFAGR